jgi:hypothetical protein
MPRFGPGDVRHMAPHALSSSHHHTMSVPASTSRQFSTESYFQTQAPPPGLDVKAKLVADFVEKWKRIAGKKVVLVTVGSSMLPGADRRAEAPPCRSSRTRRLYSAIELTSASDS